MQDGANTFTLVAKDTAGNVSAPVNATIVYDNHAPGPVRLTFDAEGDGTSARLSWLAYDEIANGNDIAEYRIYRRNESFSEIAGATMVAGIAGGQKRYTVVNMPRKQATYLAVVAVDAQGLMLNTVTAVAVTPVDTQPPEEMAVLKVIPGAGRLQLSWQASADSAGDLAGYRVYMTDGETTTKVDLASTDTSHTLTGLQAATGYPIKVTAIDNDGNETAGLTDPGITLLPNPTGLSAQALDGKADLQWNPIAEHRLLQDYQVFIETTDFTSVAALTAKLTTNKGSATATEVAQRLAGLMNGTTYYVAVAARNLSGGVDAAVTSVHVTPKIDTQGPVISSLSFNHGQQRQDISAGGVLGVDGTLTLKASDKSGLGRTEFYLGEQLLGADIHAANGVFEWAFSPIAHTDGEHRLRVKVYDILDNSTEQTATLNISLTAPPAPTITQPQPGLLTNQAQITVAGEAALHTQLQLYRNGETHGAPLAVNSQGGYSTTINLIDGDNTLSATARYPGRSTASDHSGNLSVTLNTAIPDAPEGLSASSITQGQIVLNWSAVDSSASVNQTGGYNVYRAPRAFDVPGDADVERVNSGLITQTNFTDMPVPDGGYNYRIAAVNRAGTESPLSAAVTATADSEGPQASISYQPVGAYDSETKRFGQGGVNITLQFTEALRNTPYFAVVPGGGVPVAVNLHQDTTEPTRYTGTFGITKGTLSGTAYAVLSAHDRVGNRGSEISAGKTLTIDTQAPELTRLQLNPTAPLRVDSANGLLIDVIITLNDQPAEGTTPLLVPQIDGIILDGYSAGIPLKPDTRSTAQAPRWTGQLLLPNTVGQDAQGQPSVASLSFTYQAEDDLGNRTTRIRDNHLFQVYQGDLVPLSPPQGLTASALAGGQVALNWEPVEEAVGYTVYRRAASEAGFE